MDDRYVFRLRYYDRHIVRIGDDRRLRSYSSYFGTR